MKLPSIQARLLPLAAACIAVPLAALAAPQAARAAGPIKAIGVENEYADVIGQIGGDQVSVSAIESDPNTDPHTFEVSPSVASALAGASLVVENGVGYDSWADKIMGAARAPGRQVINVQHLLGLPDSTPNPHLWYDPKTMPKVANAVAAALARLRPADAAMFHANARHFIASLAPWNQAIAAFKARHQGTPVATTEPVSNYMLQAAGCVIETPLTLQTAIMNGTDPSPQDVTTENGLLADRKVKVFVYNQQVTDNLTQSFLATAKKSGLPVVGVYETMPTGFHYQSWMLAETNALARAVDDGASTLTLQAPH